jgi:hypothetical protein
MKRVLLAVGFWLLATSEANTMGADEHISPSRKTVFTRSFPNVFTNAPTWGDEA